MNFLIPFGMLISVLSIPVAAIKPEIINPAELHGFTKAHALGINGAGQTIAFVEHNVDAVIGLEVFNGVSLRHVDCSSLPCPPDWEDHSAYRYDDETMDKLFITYPHRGVKKTASFTNHAFQVLALALGRSHPPFFKGGSALGAQGILIRYSACYAYLLQNPHELNYAGIGLYSQRALIERTKEDEDVPNWIINWATSPGHSQSVTTYLDHPVDSSLLNSLLFAARSNASVINASVTLVPFCDQFNNFSVPSEILRLIGDELETHDKVIVLSAGNLSKRSRLEEPMIRSYLNSFATDPKIAPRLLIALNVKSHLEQPDLEVNSVVLPSGKKRFLRCETSISPKGDAWGESAICAVGTNIQFEEEKFATGTSFSAPLVASLVALLKQKYPQWGAVKIVQKIKETALNLGDRQFFGHGLIDVLKALDL